MKEVIVGRLRSGATMTQSGATTDNCPTQKTLMGSKKKYSVQENTGGGGYKELLPLMLPQVRL